MQRCQIFISLLKQAQHGDYAIISCLAVKAVKVESRALIKQRWNEQLSLTSCVWRFSLFFLLQ